MRRVFNVIDRGIASRPTLAEMAPANHIETVQAAWAEALRCDFGRARDAMLCRLAETTQELALQYPNDAKVLLWNGIVLTGYAKSLGGLCSLHFQAQAKASLERAMALAPNDGAAYLLFGLVVRSCPRSTLRVWRRDHCEIIA